MSLRASPPDGWTSARSSSLLAVCLLACLGAARLGSMATTPNIEPWYRELQKPWFNPPDAAFPIAWTILFVLMALALWRVVALADGAPRLRALGVFAVQLALNVSWSFAFFAGRSPLAGLIVILLLLPAIVWTIRTFRPMDVLAAALLVPYLAWVGFATILNGAILVLNS